MRYGTGVFVRAIFLSTLSSAVFAGNLPSLPNTFSAGSTARAGEVNANFEAVRAEVDGNANDISTNANDISSNASAISANTSSITALESKSPAIGRFLVPVANVSGGTADINTLNNTARLPDAETTTVYGNSFGKPSDYVSGDITLSAIISDCAGSSIAYQTDHPATQTVYIGANGGFQLVNSCNGNCPTASIPADTGTFPFSTWYAVEVSSTLTSFADITRPYFTRRGAEANDTCTGTLTVHGFIVEYPRGQ